MSDEATPAVITEPAKQPPFAEQFAHFLTRTDTVYGSAHINILSDRGIENRLLNSLLAFIPEGSMIGGGFLTAVVMEEETAKDIDFFFTSEKAFRDTVALILQPPDDTEAWAWKGYKWKDGAVQDLDNLGDTRFITFVHETRPSIQLLRMVWYDSPEHVIDSFDFTMVQFIATGNKLTFNPTAFIDIARKRIVLHRLQFGASTLRRLIKYSQKGFYACPGSLVKICESLQQFKGPMDANKVVYVD